MENHFKYPHFLNPQPKGEDKFEGKSQVRLVESISGYILNIDSQEGTAPKMPRIIGLEGEWGSGKSNVIEQLEKKLSLGDKYKFFVYNAWGNQEDLQRRSILEALTNQLVKGSKGHNYNDKVLKGKTTIELKDGTSKSVTWEERLKYLLASKSDVETNVVPQLNIWFAVFILIVVITPIITNIAESISCLFWKCVVASIPLLVIGAVLAYKYRKSNSQKGFKARLQDTLSEMLRIYKGKEVNEHKYQTISSEEPTVVEFRKWMQDISNGLEGDNHVIMVFDDMDRLPAEKVKRLWSTIHTFFAGKGFKRIWVIIPFDREHLANAFGDADDNIVLTDSFLQKTFPVVFRVAPPVKKDFDKVFLAYLKEAFGDSEDESELQIVDRMYRLDGKKPNVRAIMSFINEMVTIRLQWSKGEISLRNIACYLLGREEFRVDPINAILEPHYIDKFGGLVMNDIDLQKCLSAIYYGVDVKDALQIPLEVFINKCIDGNGDINLYADNPNFVYVLANVIDSIDSTKVDAAIDTVIRLKDQTKLASIWSKLANRKRKNEIKGQDFDKESQILLKKTDGDLQQNVLNDWYTKVYSFGEFDGGKYYEAISNAQLFIKSENLKCSIPVTDKILTPEQFILFLKAGGETYKDWQVSCDGSAFDEYLSDLSHLNYETAQTLSCLKDDKSYSFNGLHEAIGKAYSSNDVLTKDNAGAIFLAYRNTSEKKKLQYQLNSSTVNNLYQSIHDTVIFDNKHGRSDLEAMKLCNGGDVTKDEKTNVEKIAAITDYYEDYGDLLKMVTTSSSALLKTVLATKIRKRVPGEWMTLEDIVPLYDKIKAATNVTDEELLADLDLWFDDKRQKKLDEKDISTLVPSIQSFEPLSKSDVDLAKYLCQRICSGLAQVPVDTLYSARSADSNYWIKAIDVFVGSEYLKELPKNLIDFAGRLMKDIEAGDLATGKLAHYISVLFSPLSPDKISSTLREIRNDFCNDKARMNESKFKFFEPWLRAEGSLNESKGGVCDYIINPVIKDPECQQLILSNSSFYVSIIKDASSSALRATMEDILKNNPSPDFVEFAKGCGVELKKEEEKDK